MQGQQLLDICLLRLLGGTRSARSGKLEGAQTELEISWGHLHGLRKARVACPVSLITIQTGTAIVYKSWELQFLQRQRQNIDDSEQNQRDFT